MQVIGILIIVPLIRLFDAVIVIILTSCSKEEDKTKVGRGKITHDDDNFVYLAGEKGKVIVNKKDIIAIKQ